MNAKHTKFKILSLTTLIVILGVLSSMSFAGVEWTQKAEMSTPRRAFSASVVNGKIYAIGGFWSHTSKSTVPMVEMYDPTTDSWTRKADNPLPMYAHTAAVIDGKIYVMGGEALYGSRPTETFQVYDPATDTWMRKADMPTPRSHHCAAVVDGKIYLFGGFCFDCPVPGALLPTVSAYDPSTDTWTQKADMPQAWAMARTGVLNDKIYLCTGYGDAGGLEDWETHPILAVYDPATDTWTEKAELPFGRNDSETAVVDGRMYVMGGANAELFGRINGSPVRIPDVIVYDPATDTWMDAPPMSMVRRGHRACSVDGTIYVMGGAVGQPPTGDVSRTVEAFEVTPPTNAAGPKPVDGAIHPLSWAALTWRPGIYANSHDVYLADNFDDVNDSAIEAYYGNQTETMFIVGFPGFAYPEGLAPDTTYYWRIDEVNDSDPNSPWEGPVWSFTIPPHKASNPFPADGAEGVGVEVEFKWSTGLDATSHTVYFGDNHDEVATATEGIQVMPTTYAPGVLERGKTYYWRIDEFDGSETHKGDIWSFTISRFGRP